MAEDNIAGGIESGGKASELSGEWLDVVVDIAQRRLESAAEDKRELDNKASILLAANGVLLGFLATAWGNMEATTGALSLITIVLSTIFCLTALKLRPYDDWKIGGVWNDYQKYGNDVEGLKKQIISDLSEKDDKQNVQVDDIVKNYKRGLIAFGISMFLAALSLILRLLPPICLCFGGATF